MGCTIGGSIASVNENFVNEFLGINPYEVVQTDDEGVIYEKYVSDYVEKDELGNTKYVKNEEGRYVPVFNNKKMRENSLKVATQVSTEGSVLLFNENDALPLKKDSNVSFFGISSAEYLFSAAGSGHLGVSVANNLTSACSQVGINVNSKLSNAYRILAADYGNYQTGLGVTLDGTSIGDTCYTEYGIAEAPWDKLNKTSVGNVESSFKDYGDAAFLIISRNDGEDGDTNYYTSECIGNNYLDLAHEELNILNKLIELKKQGTFKKVVLLINSAVPMQMKNISKLDLDACVWLGVGGNVSYDQIARIISGTDNPSGRLIDTYLYDNYSAPASINMGDFEFKNNNGLPAGMTYTHNDKYIVYAEGIYVGYRYFETRYEDTVLKQGNASSSAGVVDSEKSTWNYNDVVAYPFGYGTSYSEFEQSNFKVEKVRNGYNVSVTVKNISDVPGKDVVQVYLQKPYTDYDKQTGVEKPAVELVGYAKTKMLAKNESQTLTVFVDDESFKSYDAYGYKQYIVEAGDYYLAAGKNAHDALNNILALKGKTVSDGMDYNGDAKFAYVEKNIKELDLQTYKHSFATGKEITNLFDNSDPTLYEGTKDQFTNFKYLTRNHWDTTYPTPVVMDCLTSKMVQDLQYVQPIEEDPNANMPTFGKDGNIKLLDMVGLDYDDPKWEDLLDQVTWDEAVTLATYGGGIAGCPSVNASMGNAKDGPGGIGVSNPALPNIMCFPSECNMAATFNDELIEELGNAFGMEILHVGYNCIYAPGANIHRSPFSGRNWEYYSEDPYISGKMLAAECRGLTNRGVITNTKHFLLNDQERNRYGVSVWANEQSIREIYAKAFEGGVRESKMNGIMSSFNRIGCTWAGKHKGLLTDLLRGEWGFIGVVQTDAYVGTHMHQPLAESVVAGNDYTMGGPNPRALDAYRNNATVAQALRETAHRMLYTKLNSNTMNGLTTNSFIIYHTPWWKDALEITSWVSGYIAGISLLMLVVSIIVPILLKKKHRLETNEQNKDKKIKLFFDVVSKPMTFVSSGILTLLLITSIALPIAVNNAKNAPDVPQHECESICEVCGGCLDLECEYSICDDKCICNLPCEHACYGCGKCVDLQSSGGKCDEKCGDAYSNTQEFEAEDRHVLIYGGDLGGLGYGKEEGSVETYIGGFNANAGAMIKYVINAPEATKATLIISVCKRDASILFTNSILVQVNGEIIESPGVVPGLGEGDKSWVTFADVNLGCIDLIEGRNTITFTCVSGDTGTGFNFNSITLKSNTTLSWYEGAHICDSICNECGGCRNEMCDDSVCSYKCSCDKPKLEFSATDDEVYLEGATKKDGYAELTNDTQNITYKLKALNELPVILSLDVMSDTLTSDINEVIAIKVNGVSVTSSGSLTKTFTTFEFGKVTFKYGENVVEITSKVNSSIKVKGIIIASDEQITYKNPNEFLTTSNYVTIEGKSFKSTENCISMIENAKGSVVTFPIKSSKATNADLYFNLASRSTPAKISDIWEIRVNGQLITTDADLPTNGREYFTYNDVFMNNVSLAEGHNDVTIKVISDSISINTNLRAAIFDNTDAILSWSTEGPQLNKTVIEAEYTTLNKITYNNQTFPIQYLNNPTDPVFGIYSGEGFLGGINDAGVYKPGEATISFKVTALEAVSAKFYFGAGVSGSANAANYKISVGSTDYTSAQNWSGGGWYDWAEHYYGTIDLSAGSNVITITILAGNSINIDFFAIYSTTDVTYNH